MCALSPRKCSVLTSTLVAFWTLVVGYPSSASDGYRIVGGQNTTIDRFPYQISLRAQGRHSCGGSVVKLDVVITAAHCIPWFGNLNELSVVAGTSYSSEIGIERKLKDIRVHPDYEMFPTRYDVALLVLVKPLYYSELIQPINLAKSGDLLRAGTKAIVSGWGALSEGGPYPDQLQYVDVNIITNEECIKKYSDKEIWPDMICAGYEYGGKDSCQSDSGGPLVIGNVLVGIVSWGTGCARPNYPGVYARVSYVRDWIDGQLQSLGY